MHDFIAYLENRLEQIRDGKKTEKTDLKLIIATATLLQQQAVHSISADMIAAQAGFAHGTLYRYYAGKREAIAQTLFDFFEFVHATRPQTPKEASDFDAIEIGNLHYIMCFRQNVGLMRCHFQFKDEEEEALIAQIGRNADKKMAKRIIKRVLRRVDVPKASMPELRLTVYGLISMVDELLLKIYGQSNPPLVEFADDPKLIAHTLSRLWYSALYLNDFSQSSYSTASCNTVAAN